MARPNKVGLDYFSLDVKFDDEVELIKAEHGIKGIGILIMMYQTIYADKGYYRKWNERNQILFSNKVSEDRNEVVNVINDCIKWDIFDKKMYEKHEILTSRRIQKQYIKATYKRAEVEIIEDYLLIKKDGRKNITYITVSDIGNHETNKVSDGKSTQSNKDKNKDKNKKSNNKRSASKPSPNPPPEKPKFDKDSMPYKAAVYLRKRILENNPRQPVPDKNPKDLEDWALELDRLNRLGPVGAKDKGYSWKEIGEIMKWCQDHHFWKSNILSAGKFREQITKLENQMKSEKQKPNSKSEQLKELYAEAKREDETGESEVNVL